MDTYNAYIDGASYGVPRMMDLLEKYESTGTFFVDVYNRRTVSEEIIASTVQEIDRRGHEVGLHTHPAFPTGNRGYGMSQTMQSFSLPEQIRIVSEGAKLISDWIGTAPLCHRAGGYGANFDTLKALAANNIPIDSSLFYGYPFCDLNAGCPTINAPVVIDGVQELPVTTTQCDLALGPFTLFSLIKKLDPDWCSPDELRRQIRASTKHGPTVIFLHSYSFLDLENDYRPDMKAIAQMDDLLSFITNELGNPVRSIKEAQARGELNFPKSNSRTTPAPPPIVKSNLLGREWELALWLIRKVRLRHLKLLKQR